METEIPNIRRLPLSAQNHQQMIQDALDRGCSRAKIIEIGTIAIRPWVKLQCQFGCTHYGKLLTCPPFTPHADEMSEILLDYRKAILMHIGPDSNLREVVIGLEESCKSRGFYKAFALCSGPCDICEVCTVDTLCKYPEKTRPTLQACGIDVHSTVSNNGWGDLENLSPCGQENNIGMVLLD